MEEVENFDKSHGATRPRQRSACAVRHVKVVVIPFICENVHVIKGT